MAESEPFMLVREDDDPLVDVRISLGRKQGIGIYLVFRGDLDKARELLELAAQIVPHVTEAQVLDNRGKAPG